MISATAFQAGKHLQEDQLQPPEAACPLCGSTQPRNVALPALQTQPSVDLLRCSQCQGVSASRLPTSEALDAYYSRYYSANSANITCGDPQRFANHLLRYCSLVPKGDHLTILDFGGGNGRISFLLGKALLRASASRQVEVSLVDYCTDTVRSDGEVEMVRYDTLDAVDGKHFDIVIASAILEHIPRPASEIRRLLESLRPGGVFYARTPFVVPMLSVLKALGIRIDFTFPGHIHDLGQGFWDGMLDRLGFDTEAFQVLRSAPSVVETSFRTFPVRTLAANVLKAPWKLLGERYGFVGGWEVFIQRRMRSL
jgi:SAM-dependent methyltransferase